MKRVCTHLRWIGLGMGLAVSAGSLAQACDLALVLAVDVSGSVDPQEYRIQMDGLAEALRDGIVAEALVDAQAWLTLVQWTGSSRQQTSISWAQMTTFDAVEAFAERVTQEPLLWRNYSTAIGEALHYSLASFDDIPDCRRKVIDVSGDGSSNEGLSPRDMHAALNAEKVTVNAVVIETDGEDLTGYFWENVITGEGAFVMTANGFADYPDRIRRKLQRETVRQLSDLDKGHLDLR
ncbi:hypothetical protein SuNHUV7_18570 (plasmid) [Pseudoseohaeicola sp. NH-UV-7]|uniref:DUF1194 domain-containing protein n=1 Tax=Sulfitobacter sp. TBRI5 TaxID=2989732 RepID=UPI003A67416E